MSKKFIFSLSEREKKWFSSIFVVIPWSNEHWRKFTANDEKSPATVISRSLFFFIAQNIKSLKKEMSKFDWNEG